MLIFWSLVRNSVVLAVYLLFSVACFLTVHEHFRKVCNLTREKSETLYDKVVSDFFDGFSDGLSLKYQFIHVDVLQLKRGMDIPV